MNEQIIGQKSNQNQPVPIDVIIGQINQILQSSGHSLITIVGLLSLIKRDVIENTIAMTKVQQQNALVMANQNKQKIDNGGR